MSNYNIDIIDLIKKVRENFKRLLIYTALGALLSTSIAFLIPAYYESVSKFTVLSPSTTDPLLLFDLEKDNILFGDSYDNYRGLALGESNQALIHMIKKFNLIDHYEIDYKDSLKNLEVAMSTLEDNVEFKISEYNFITIEAIDKDPKMARDIADEFIAYIDYAITYKYRYKNNRILDNLKEQKEIKKEYIASISDSLLNIKQKLQAQLGSKMLQNLIEEAKDGSDFVGLAIDNNGSRLLQLYINLKMQQEEENVYFVELNNKFQTLKDAMSAKILSLFVLEKPTVNHEKAGPPRLLIIIFGTVLSFGISLFAISIRDILNSKE